MLPEIVKKKRGTYRQRRIHLCRTQAGWCDFAKPPLHHRTLLVGKLPGWQRRRVTAAVKTELLACHLSLPLQDWVNVKAALLTTAFPLMHMLHWFVRKAVSRYLGKQLSMSSSPLQSMWTMSIIRVSLQYKSGGSSVMERQRSSSRTLGSPSSWDSAC